MKKIYLSEFENNLENGLENRFENEQSPILEVNEDEVQFAEIIEIARCISGLAVGTIGLFDDRKKLNIKSLIGIENLRLNFEYFMSPLEMNLNEIIESIDLRVDEKYKNHQLVISEPRFVYFINIPLSTDGGMIIGHLSLFDYSSKQMTCYQKEVLKKLANQAVELIKIRKKYYSESKMLQENKLLQEKINRNLKFIHKLTDQVPGVVYQFDLLPNGQMKMPYSSKGIIDIFEMKSELLQENADLVFDLIHPEDLNKVKESINKSAYDLSIWECEFRVNLPQQGCCWRKGHAVPEKQENGIISWYGFVTDITDSKLQNNKLIQAQKMSSLGEMSAGVAHEINNPLAILIGRIALIKKGIVGKTLDDSKIIEHLEKLDSVAHRIAKIVKGLKVFSRSAENEKTEMISLTKIINDSIELCQEKLNSYSVQINTKVSTDQLIECRPIQLTQVFVNLVSNSIFAIKDLDNKWIEFECFEDKQNTKILITDSGFGINKDIVNKIMDPFFTTKDVGEGSGLGLSISKGIVEELGGTFDYLEMCPQTTFLIQIPKYNASKKSEKLTPVKAS